MSLGVDSIRINGRKIEDLPMAANAHARQQLPLVRDSERQTNIQNVLHKYPKQSVAYLDSRITECHENVNRCTNLKNDTLTEISNYELNINQVGLRESKLQALDPNGAIRKIMSVYGAKKLQRQINGVSVEDDLFPIDLLPISDQIKQIKNKYPPYNVSEMKKQILQFRDTIEKCDSVIAQEYTSVAELSMTLALCKQRDLELKGLSASIVG